MDYATIGDTSGRWLAIPVFVLCWIYCVLTYGFLLGASLGWFPSLLVAAAAYAACRFLWPLVAFGIVGVCIFLWVITHP